MDSDGLPLVGPGIDYTKVEAINQKRTIAFINHFVTHTCRFLNRFSYVCEEKLENLSGRLQQLEICMNILEGKLASIPGLESVTAPQASSANTTSSAPPPPSGGDPASTTAPPPQTDAPPAPPAYEEAPLPSAEEVKPQNTVSQDPRFIKFFKMLQFGVPPPAVKGKMAAEGLDPDLLDTPDAAAPDGAPLPANTDSDDSDNSVSDFSDD